MKMDTILAFRGQGVDSSASICMLGIMSLVEES